MKDVNIINDTFNMGVLVEYREFDTKKALKNLKNFRKGFEKSCGKYCDVYYFNYASKEDFADRYENAKQDDRISTYAVKSGDALYIDLECLLNCTEKEAFDLGVYAMAKRLIEAGSYRL